MNNSCTGIILAGGRNTRFSGTNKAFVSIGGKRILDRIYDVFCDLFQEIILVTNDPVQYLEWDFDIVTDLFPIRSSLTGIHAGLFYMTTPYAFVAACDTPFIQTKLVKTILKGIAPRIDIVTPETAEGYQPLCSVYSKRCLNPITRQLEKQELKIDRIFKKVRLKTISEKTLREQDSDLISFYNINTPEDLAMAEEILSRISNEEFV
ncbi:MAG: molybdenum cofactor guanylyltransferase [Deltaproteobacteria bacterium]|nr:molybdenum cofactor guanylyltransferase [Deltaproteobacteria bacterium]